MRERADAIRASKMKIFVRRGGPNYKAGLEAMRRLGADTGIPIEVCVCGGGGGGGGGEGGGMLRAPTRAPLAHTHSLARPLAHSLTHTLQVYGPEASMTGICKLAIEYVKQFDANGGAAA